jgi:hypothetical protein
MRASTRKRRPFALAHRMQMHGMEPWRQRLDVDRDDHPRLARTKGSAANAGARSILDLRPGLVLRVGARRVEQEAYHPAKHDEMCAFGHETLPSSQTRTLRSWRITGVRSTSFFIKNVQKSSLTSPDYTSADALFSF